MTEGQKNWKTFLKAAAIRAVRTWAQVAIGFITVGAAISDVNWGMMLSVSTVAAVYSILTSVITGLPEAPDWLAHHGIKGQKWGIKSRKR